MQHSPKPAPLPLNLEDAARSPALKKAMMENPQGEKHQIETLRNLRTVFISLLLIGRRFPSRQMSSSDRRKWKTRIRGELDQTQVTEIVKPNLTPIPRELTRIRNRFPGLSAV